MRRFKKFHLVANEMLVSMLFHADGYLTICAVFCIFLNPIEPNVPFIYPLKTSGNQRLSRAIKRKDWA